MGEESARGVGARSRREESARGVGARSRREESARGVGARSRREAPAPRLLRQGLGGAAPGKF